MKNTKLSQLLRIISRGPRHPNLNSRPYTPRDFKKEYLRTGNNRVRQEDYRSRNYEAHKHPNKMGYK